MRSASSFGNGNKNQKRTIESHKRIESERKIPESIAKAPGDSSRRTQKYVSSARKFMYQENPISQENQKKKIRNKASPWPIHLIEKITVPYLSKGNLYRERGRRRETMGLWSKRNQS